MTTHSTDRLNDVRPKMLRAGFPLDRLQVEKEAIGYAFAKALHRAGLTRQDATYIMGYTNQRVISDWTSGKENVQPAKLRLLGKEFWRQWVIAQAEMEGMPVVTSITTEELDGPMRVRRTVEWVTASEEVA